MSWFTSPESGVLVVEDDPGTREVLRVALEQVGYSVCCAGHGQEALERLRTGPTPQLILLDLMMPVMDGWEFLRTVKADPALAAIPVVVISAVDQAQAKAAALGAADYLRKPIELEQLTDKVRDHTTPG